MRPTHHLSSLYTSFLVFDLLKIFKIIRESKSLIFGNVVGISKLGLHSPFPNLKIWTPADLCIRVTTLRGNARLGRSASCATARRRASRWHSHAEPSPLYTSLRDTCKFLILLGINEYILICLFLIKKTVKNYVCKGVRRAWERVELVHLCLRAIRIIAWCRAAATRVHGAIILIARKRESYKFERILL